MCDVKEAERHEQLGEIYENEGNKSKAIEHYLEAAAIYVLNIELLKKESLLTKANHCYQQVQRLRGEKQGNFSKTELARLTVKELNFTQSHLYHHKHNHHTALSRSMCIARSRSFPDEKVKLETVPSSSDEKISARLPDWRYAHTSKMHDTTLSEIEVLL